MKLTSCPLDVVQHSSSRSLYYIINIILYYKSLLPRSKVYVSAKDIKREALSRHWPTMVSRDVQSNITVPETCVTNHFKLTLHDVRHLPC